MATAGKNLRIKVSTNGTTFNLVADLNDATMSLSGDNQDITTFGQDYINRLQGLKDCTYSLGGFYKSDDTNGQVVIKSALLNDTALYVQFLPDGTTGFQQEVKVSSFELSASVDGTNDLSIDLDGTGAITTV